MKKVFLFLFVLVVLLVFSFQAHAAYTFTVNKTGSGSGTVTSSPPGINCGIDCTEIYTDGTFVTLTATADSGSTFTGWSGDYGCSYAYMSWMDLNVWMDSSKTCIARFNLNQTPIYISPDGLCNGNTPCYSKIQDGVNAAGNGATIKVAQGLYYENIKLPIIISGLTIQGGWNSTFTSRIEDPSLTIVDGSNNGSVFYILPDYDYEAFVDATIDGFTIRNGSDGGVWVDLSWYGEIDMNLTNNIITANSGGGVKFWFAYGGASITMTNNIIKENSGGGLSVYAWNYAQVTMTNNIMTGNSAYIGGGIFYFADDGGYIGATLINNTITNNSATSNGGGIYAASSFFDGWVDIEIVNTITWGNTAAGISNDIYLEQGCSYCPMIINASYSDIGAVLNNQADPGTYNDLGNNINTNPHFKNTSKGDYHLKSRSLCIDKGTNSGAPATDFEGDIRPVDGNRDGQSYADIGADEYIPHGHKRIK